VIILLGQLGIISAAAQSHRPARSLAATAGRSQSPKLPAHHAVRCEFFFSFRAARLPKVPSRRAAPPKSATSAYKQRLNPIAARQVFDMPSCYAQTRHGTAIVPVPRSPSASSTAHLPHPQPSARCPGKQLRVVFRPLELSGGEDMRPVPRRTRVVTFTCAHGVSCESQRGDSGGGGGIICGVRTVTDQWVCAGVTLKNKHRVPT